MRPTKSPGTLSIFRPKKSLICVLAIRTAMPLVKPIDDRPRDVLDRRPQARQAEHHEHHAGHQRA